MNEGAAIPVTVLTGFLGSGKTTLLNRLLARPEFAHTIVIINEFGEIGLDHLLVERSNENLTLLNNGCLCCTVRGDLVATMRDLAERQTEGAIGAYDRMIIETTGLADPAPILHTLMADPAVIDRHRLAGVVTTVDAVNGLQTFERHTEAVKQAAVADRLLMTKCDLAAAETTAALRRRLGGLNYAAPVIEVFDGRMEPGDLFEAGLYDVNSKPEMVRAWLGAEKAAEDRGHHHHGHAHDVNRHDDHVKAYCITLEEPVRWDAFGHWLELMAAMRGEQLLRVKGIVAIADDPERPMVIHGVQHIFHPPVRLDAWPSQDRRTRLVFITRDVPQDLIETTLQKFGGADRARMSVT